MEDFEGGYINKEDIETFVKLAKVEYQGSFITPEMREKFMGWTFSGTIDGGIGVIEGWVLSDKSGLNLE